MGLLRLAVMRRPIGRSRRCACSPECARRARRPAPTQTPLKFSLDGRTGGAEAAFVLAQDRGYFKAEGLDVGIDEAAQPLEPITRVAGGGYDLAFADINAMIRYRDQHPAAPIKAVFMVYNTPPYAVVARKSRGIAEPRQLEGKKLGAPPAGATYAQWPLFAKLNGIDTTKVTMETDRDPGARADAGGRADRRGARRLVPSLCRSQGPRRAGRRHRADADGRLRTEALRQCPGGELQVRRREPGGGQARSCAPSCGG